MKINTVIATSLALVISCAGVKQSVENGAVKAKDTFVECVKADIGRTIPEVGLTILAAITQILMAGPDNYVTKLDEIGNKYGEDAEACAVKTVNTVLTAGDGTNLTHAMSPAATRAAAVLSSKGWKFKAE